MRSRLWALAAFGAIAGVTAVADDPTTTVVTDGVTATLVEPYVATDPWLLCVTVDDGLTVDPLVVTADQDVVAVVSVESGDNYIVVPDDFSSLTVDTSPQLPGSN